MEDNIRATEEERVMRILEILMVEPTPENKAQMRVFLKAYEIFLERNRRHRAQWRVGGVRGILVDLRKKGERLWNEFMLSAHPPKDVDSAIDLINYAAFFIQAQEEEQAGAHVGSWIWPDVREPESDTIKQEGILR